MEEIEDGGIAEPDPGVADQAQAAAEAVATAEQPERELHSFEIDPAQVGPPLAALDLPAAAFSPPLCAGFSCKLIWARMTSINSICTPRISGKGRFVSPGNFQHLGRLRGPCACHASRSCCTPTSCTLTH